MRMLTVRVNINLIDKKNAIIMQKIDHHLYSTNKIASTQGFFNKEFIARNTNDLTSLWLHYYYSMKHRCIRHPLNAWRRSNFAFCLFYLFFESFDLIGLYWTPRISTYVLRTRIKKSSVLVQDTLLSLFVGLTLLLSWHR